MSKQSPPSKIKLTMATLLSGLLWYFAIGISGQFGFLLWVAPLPILWISLQTSGRISFLCAWLAYFLGRLSWIPFLLVLMPVVPIILVTLLPPFIFGLSILLNRWIVLKSQSPWSVLAFPAIVAAIEFLIFNNPVDGTAGSLAYTQSNYVTIIQLASVTGIWGIVFLASLFPAAIALLLYFRNQRKMQITLVCISGLVLISAFVFGIVRSTQPKDVNEVVVGITSASEDLYQVESSRATMRERIVQQYQQQIESLAKQGAQYVLFPEKIFTLHEVSKDSLLTVLKGTALQAQTTIIGGIAVRKKTSRINLVEFISPRGSIQEYQKRFHVKGFEGDFEQGNKVGFLKEVPFAGGMAICKDMDFPAWLREYQQVDLLFVPAWDFVQDGWLHSRMAIMRGVENGYTIVRAGRQGRLTVSDYRGVVIAEANVENGEASSLLAKAPIYHIKTTYSKWGDWFGWLCIFLTVVFTVQAFVITNRKNQVN
ncbi:MAG: hypothetical protein HOP30_07170 [Cyclobacteriaceae bacterium]|nr:hypothetical protein [Cyclobacteriaceae bacterium]